MSQEGELSGIRAAQPTHQAHPSRYHADWKPRKLHALHAFEPALLQQPRERCLGEVLEMYQGVHDVPRLAEDPELERVHVGNGHVENPSGIHEISDLGERGRGVGKVLEDMAHDHGIEGLPGNLSVADHRLIQTPAEVRHATSHLESRAVDPVNLEIGARYLNEIGTSKPDVEQTVAGRARPKEVADRRGIEPLDLEEIVLRIEAALLLGDAGLKGRGNPGAHEDVGTRGTAMKGKPLPSKQVTALVSTADDAVDALERTGPSLLDHLRHL